MRRLLFFFLFFRWLKRSFQNYSNLPQVPQSIELKPMPVWLQRQSLVPSYCIVFWEQIPHRKVFHGLNLPLWSLSLFFFCGLTLVKCSPVSTRMIQPPSGPHRRLIEGMSTVMVLGVEDGKLLEEVDSWSGSKKPVHPPPTDSVLTGLRA